MLPAIFYKYCKVLRREATGLSKEKEKEEPAYADEFEKYSMAVSLLGMLCKEGLLPEGIYDKIIKDYQKDIEKYRRIC